MGLTLKWSVDKLNTVRFGITIATLVGLALLSYFSLRRLHETTRQVRQAHQTLEQIDLVMSHLKDAETGQRGYLLTGNQQYLQPYDEATGKIVPELELLATLVRDRPAQAQRLTEMQSRVQAKVFNMGQTIELRQTQGFEAAQKIVEIGRGKQLMDEIRAIATVLRSEQRLLLDQRTSYEEQQGDLATWITVGSVVLQILLITGIILQLNREARSLRESNQKLERYTHGMEQLVNAVQKLSMARDLDTILTVVKQAARELTGADGATLVLREQDQCYYIEENAIAPLWKGERFPIDQCISGWAMQNRQAAVIEDILQDARIPQEVYQQTFVKSMVMVPIRTMQPIGAIGNYWVEPHQPQVDQVKLLQALADTTAVAIENVQVYAELEERIQQRTAELHQLNGVLLRSNQELEQFAYVASHDLQEPLRTVASYTELLAKKYRGQLDEKAEKYINYVVDGASRMQQLINDLLMYSRVGRQTLQLTPVDCNQVVQQVCKTLEIGISENNATITYDPLPTVLADVTQLTQLVQNLIGNAIKYRGEDPPVIHITATQQATEWVFSIQDNGIGIDPQYTDRIFILFQRLHTRRKYSGTGIGLAICKKIVELHQGRIWVESQVGQGSTFYVALPDRYEPQAEVLLEAMV